MRTPKHRDIPPYVRPVYYKYREEEKRHALAAKKAPFEWCAIAVMQGLLALGFVALGRASVRNGWPFWLLLSMGSAPKALEESTKALSLYLTLRRERLQK